MTSASHYIRWQQNRDVAVRLWCNAPHCVTLTEHFTVFTLSVSACSFSLWGGCHFQRTKGVSGWEEGRLWRFWEEMRKGGRRKWRRADETWKPLCGCAINRGATATSVGQLHWSSRWLSLELRHRLQLQQHVQQAVMLAIVFSIVSSLSSISLCILDLLCPSRNWIIASYIVTAIFNIHIAHCMFSW